MASSDGENQKQPLSRTLGVSRLTLLFVSLGLVLGLFVLIALSLNMLPGPFEVCHGRPPGHCHGTWTGQVTHQH